MQRPGVEKSLVGLRSIKKNGESSGRHRLLQSPGKSMDCGLGNCALHSCVPDHLNQVPELEAQPLDRWEALAHLHEESRDPAAVQEAICLPAAQVHSGHGPPSCCGDTITVSWPCPARPPGYTAQLELQSRGGALESWGPRVPNLWQCHRESMSDSLLSTT